MIFFRRRKFLVELAEIKNHPPNCAIGFEVAFGLAGTPDPKSGMIVNLSIIDEWLQTEFPRKWKSSNWTELRQILHEKFVKQFGSRAVGLEIYSSFNLKNELLFIWKNQNWFHCIHQEVHYQLEPWTLSLRGPLESALDFKTKSMTEISIESIEEWVNQREERSATLKNWMSHSMLIFNSTRSNELV